MTVELAFRQASRWVHQASNSDKVGSPGIGIEFPATALMRTIKTYSNRRPFTMRWSREESREEIVDFDGCGVSAAACRYFPILGSPDRRGKARTQTNRK